MDEYRVDYCTKCIDDHENRLRTIERNDKVTLTFRTELEKLEIRINSLEKYVDGQIAVMGKTKETKTDFFGIIAVVIAVLALIINLLK